MDIAQGAVETAQLNAQNCGVGHRATFVRSNWFEHVEGKFDLIVSNPPYIPAPEIRNLQKEVQNHDPIRALDGGIDGLEPYKFLLPRCKNYLEAGGALSWKSELVSRRTLHDSRMMQGRLWFESYPTSEGCQGLWKLRMGISKISFDRWLEQITLPLHSALVRTDQQKHKMLRSELVQKTT